ncbi:hypothetical protein MPTK1_5g17520 [Marchantia polymorpha subsp. ruderalis]|nr:hypothetical protein MARPO_0084s0004 [Marchantia polymorpha]BBN12118.1 hypothetical protein Mp_5g17520 [Marchantia polymorpha subsp. ruderalis]|eukprot:PTQ33908.1 hypothetical protein MARPO_0084s0004 [Marchantia polymorpha]
MDETCRGQNGRSPGGVSEAEIYSSPASRARYEAYSRLQASAVAFGEYLPIPEIVAVGGQSDGKSSLLEALLGFRFNVREVEMGTRRPLMLQMIHDPGALEPRCRLQDEDSDEYGPAIVPASAVAEAIRSRTELFLKRTGTAVASKPIVMRAEYAFCSNLTIIDTPGFILKAKKGESESTPDDIVAMVRELAAPPNRILVFLQQSSVEWCSSLWLDTVRAIDPALRRTIVVVSKFDNRLKEFAEKWEVDRYLSAGGYLGDSTRPFFVALPKERSSVSNEEFRRSIARVDNEVVRHLRENVSGGFDEDQFGDRIGFSNLRRFLEAELQRRYRQSAPATLALLEQRCDEVAARLASIDARLSNSADVASLRRATMMHAAALGRQVVALLDGVAEPDPAEWGRTTYEERTESRITKWPGVAGDVLPANAGLRMYGGAAFERVLEEFRYAACSLDCPPISRVEVANILLAQAGRPGAAAAAISIARSAAKSWLSPLLDTACNRLAHVLSSLFDLGLERIRIEDSYRDSASCDRLEINLSGYVAFHAALRRAHQRFIRDSNKRCKESVREQLMAVTSSYIHQLKCGWESNATVFSSRPGTGFSQNLSAPPLCLDGSDGIEPGLLGAFAEAGDEENVPPHGSQTDNRMNVDIVSPGKGERLMVRESQMTVPDTPSPDQHHAKEAACAAKRKEFALNNSRFVAAVGGGDHRKKKGVGSRLTLQQANDGRSLNCGNKTDPYTEVCTMATEHFGKIRDMLVKRTVPLTLNSGFLNPIRDRLAGEVAVELFATTDERFMEMFVAPEALEKLQKERDVLYKHCLTLSNCLEEFRTLACSL